MNDCKPNSQTRKQLAEELNMSVRSIQVWFQNRRAKLKTMLKNGKMTDAQMIEYLKNQKQEDATSSPGFSSSFEDLMLLTLKLEAHLKHQSKSSHPVSIPKNGHSHKPTRLMNHPCRCM